MSTDSASSESQSSHRRRNQIATAISLAVVLALIFLLATSITGMQLLPGEAFSIPRMVPPQLASSGAPESDLLLIIFKILLAVSIAALPIYIIISLLSKEGRKRLLINLLMIGLLFIGVNWLRSQRSADDLLQGDGMGLETPDRAKAPKAKPLPDFNANPSDETVLAITIAISLLIVGIAAAMVWYIARRRQMPPPSAMDALADEAQQAIHAIQSGSRLEETITRCYREMCRVLQEERGIERGVAMTPSEFEDVLAGRGMPKQAVHQLTHLFEDIRYGSKPAGPREEQIAIESLSAIVAACGPQRARA